jgi:hypothetical protein
MKYFRVNILAVFLLLGWVSNLAAANLFSDGFEQGTLRAAWSVSATNQGRATVTTTNTPATGSYHLVLDDRVNDAIASASEATLSLDLSYKKNVALTFKAKSLGNESHPAPSGSFTTTRNYDGVAISINGGTTWISVQSLAAVPTAWTSYSVTLDSAVASLGGGFGANFRIRFSEYDESSAPIDGIAIDDISVTGDEDQRIVLDVPGPLLEGASSTAGYILIAVAQPDPLTVTLSASPSGQLDFPTTVIVPAWETYTSFQFSAVDDALANLSRSVTITATAVGATAGSASVTIHDNDAPSISLTLPAQVIEGTAPTTNNATLTMSRAATVDLTVSLTCAPSGELTFPSTVTVPAGQTQKTFTVGATNDSRIDGNTSATLTGSATGISSASASTVAVDDETRTMSFTLPSTIQEGVTTTGTVRIPGTLTAPLNVVVTSGDTAILTVQGDVTIPAGQTSAQFSMTAVENAAKDGSKLVSVTASANTFASSTQSITKRDNEVAGYRFGALPDFVNVSSPLTVTITAIDLEGNSIGGYAGSVNLSVILPDGSSQSPTPAIVALSGAAGWTGNVTLPVLNTAPLRLKASDGAGNNGLSTAFDILRELPLTTSDLLWDASRGRIYASVPATDTTANANKIVAIDPSNLQITSSLAVNQDPGQLAITSGSEFLYAALNANGTVGKVTLSSFTLASSFAVGTDPHYGTLYAQDLTTVAGQPDVVVLSQYRKSVSPSHNGVAAYDNGVMRPVKTQDHTGSNLIEPSADPTVFFGQCSESTEFGFRRLKLGTNGMTELEVSRDLLVSYFNTDMKSDGNRVFSTRGVQVDGALMKRIGTFPATGPVRPDLASNRVYFIEPPYDYSSSYSRIGAYDPVTSTLIRRLTLPTVYTSAASFIRWGTNGLAFRTANSVVFINSSQLVPSDPQTDLAVTVQALPNPATLGSPLTYSVQVKNLGSNVARSTQLGVTLSDSQTIQSVTSSAGTATTNGLVISLPVGDLAPGGSTQLTIITLPQSAGSLSCTAGANSNAIDPNFSNNTGFKLVSVGFQASIDIVNQLRLTANNLVYDATRNLLWASIPSTVEAPLGKSIVSINPVTGLISDPIPINNNPYVNSVALTPDGRYLYLGLSDVAEVHRVDLTSPIYASQRIPLGMNGWGSAGYAEDIEPLDGDGTSFIAATTGDSSAVVFDNLTRRPSRTGIYTVDRIERTATPGTFVGYLTSSSGFGTTRLPVTSSGVSISQTVSNLISGYYTDIKSSSNLLLSSTGQLIDTNTFTLKAGLGLTGRPCIDSANQRAYLVNGNALRAYDTTTGALVGTLALPTTSAGDWAQGCVRWGLDGFAILGNDGRIYITRWSLAIPATNDSNTNGVSDAWEATYFNALGFPFAGDNDGDGVTNVFEYFFGSSPLQKSANPVQARMVSGDSPGKMHLIFPRRVGVSQSAYKYEVSENLQTWQLATAVTETILSTQTVDGVTTETVDASITCPWAKGGFVRLKWQSP